MIPASPVVLIVLATAAVPETKLLVPAYFYPSGDGLKAWDTLLASAAKAPVAAIVNPDSGPGKRVDANYSALFRKAEGSKITLLGYVTLSYGKRPLTAVRADVDSWVYFYPDVRGIFFDEQPSQPETAGFALEAFAHARAKIEHAVLVSNPGTTCAREYLAGKDAPAVCLFEGPGGFAKYQPPDWADRLRGDRLVLLTYGVGTADGMRAALREAARARAGYVYVTDATGANPWDRLPSYWNEEVAEVLRAK